MSMNPTMCPEAQQGLNKALKPTRMLVTERAQSSRLRAKHPRGSA
jgi:hypothetical protein